MQQQIQTLESFEKDIEKLQDKIVDLENDIKFLGVEIAEIKAKVYGVELG